MNRRALLKLSAAAAIAAPSLLIFPLTQEKAPEAELLMGDRKVVLPSGRELDGYHEKWLTRDYLHKGDMMFKYDDDNLTDRVWYYWPNDPFLTNQYYRIEANFSVTHAGLPDDIWYSTHVTQYEDGAFDGYRQRTNYYSREILPARIAPDDMLEPSIDKLIEHAMRSWKLSCSHSTYESDIYV